MYIAKGMYKFSTPSETKVDALLQLFDYKVFEENNSLVVTLQPTGYNPSNYSYSKEFTLTEAVEDALKSNYKAFNIKLYKEV